MNINGLSIADLKASFDFINIHIEELKKKATKEKQELVEIIAYKEAKKIEHELYNELLNKILLLK